MGSWQSTQAAPHSAQAAAPQWTLQEPFGGAVQFPRGRRDQSHASPHKLFTDDENLQDKLVGVIVTIVEGQSYDAMFQEVKPTTVPGERISTYSITCRQVEKLYVFLSSLVPLPEDQEQRGWRSLVEDVRQVDADSVVFNWECCSGCGNHAFPCSDGPCLRQGQEHVSQDQAARPSTTMQFMGFALRSGYTVMCSDFSLKSLIHEWSEEHLGPNPFLQVGSCDRQFALEFIPSELQDEEVPQQLQVVGELCADRGKAVVTALGDTIVYTVNPNRKHTDLYDLKVLTVVTEYGDGAPISEDMKCTVGINESEKKGSAGHVALTYSEGGQLVTSMGHWIELTKIDASVESVMRAAAHNFGDEEADLFRQGYMQQASDEDRSRWVQSHCQKFVTQSAPSRMKARTKFSSGF